VCCLGRSVREARSMDATRSPFLSGALAWINSGAIPVRCDTCAFEWTIQSAAAVDAVSDRSSMTGFPDRSLVHHGVGAGGELVLVTRMRPGDGRDRVPLDGQCEYRRSRRAGTS
jgi:hypothetical protein